MISELCPDSLEFIILVNFSTSKHFYAFQTDIWTAELWQIAKFDIFKKVLFRNLHSSTHMALSLIKLQQSCIYKKISCFSSISTFLKFSYILKHIGNRWQFSIQPIIKDLKNFFCFSIVSIYSSKATLDYHHQKLNLRVASGVAK